MSINPESNPINSDPTTFIQDAVGTRLVDHEQQSWVRQHRIALGVSGIAVAGALSLVEFSSTVDAIKQDAHWAVPAFIVTESLAWGGAALMVASAGHKIGNPMTVKKRLTQIASELEKNKLFKRGFAINVVGAAATSAVITVGAVSSLPSTTWPLAAGAAVASLAFSALPLRHANKAYIKESAQ